MYPLDRCVPIPLLTNVFGLHIAELRSVHYCTTEHTREEKCAVKISEFEFDIVFEVN